MIFKADINGAKKQCPAALIDVYWAYFVLSMVGCQ
jgi:hypothetical protein|tara:strand:+ start:358 stop:462 length:105 start_codon:yes stop_codon:yes gene_type:complete